MATSAQIKKYARNNNCSCDEAKAHFANEAAIRPIAGITATVYARVKHEDICEEVMFIRGVIPDEPKVSRNELIGCFGIQWSDNFDVTVSMLLDYLGHSPTINMLKMGVNATNILDINTGRLTGSLDINDLGIFIEFTSDHRGVSTDGPQFMTVAEVDDIAAEYMEQCKDTHKFNIYQ